MRRTRSFPAGLRAGRNVFGVSYRGHPTSRVGSGTADTKYPIAADATFWKDRVGVARLAWGEHVLLNDDRLSAVCPRHRRDLQGALDSRSANCERALTCRRRLRPRGSPAVNSPQLSLSRSGRDGSCT